MSRKLLNLCLMALFSVASTAAWALSDVNGVYQISSAADWEEFAALVNGGEVNACAVLTADIDTGIDGTMIGVADAQGQRYDGTFDGQGHTIKINLYPEAENTGLFRYIGWRAVIQNLKVTGTITTSSKFAGGIVGVGRGIVRNCWSDVVIKSSVAGDATHGGLIGYGYSGTIVENCLVQTTIQGETTQNCGGVVGWAGNPVNIVNCLIVSDGNTIDVSNGLSRNIARNDSRVKAVDVETYNQDIYANRPGGACYNNYVTTDWETNASIHNPAVTVVPLEDLADGRICYQLNNDQSRIAWVQTIGVDPFPVPAAFGSGQVYASEATDCDGKSEGDLTFSNEQGGGQSAAHQFDKYGICSVCGLFNFHYFEVDDPEKFDQADRSVLLRSKEDFDVVEGMNRICNGFKLNLKLMNDVEYIAEDGKYIFNPSDWIDGNFNGQGHAVTIGMTDIGDHGGFLPEMAGNVENLILHGSITTNGTRTGSIAGEARMALVRNVFSDVDITTSIAGDNTSGGLFGWMGDKERHVENTIYAGTFTCPANAPYVRVGGFCGWAGSKTYFTNCAMLGNVIGAGDQSAQSGTENSASTSRNPGNLVCENVYVVNPVTGRDVADRDTYILYENESGIANGELAFFLNGKQSGLDRFFQVIGTDPEPMPIAKEGGLVYSASSSFRCDGTPLDAGGYTNDPSGEPVIPPHQFVNGWCVNCGKFDENFVTPVDGWLEISDGAELAWWSNYANIHKDVCARLTDDIDMDGYMENYVPVEMFVGEFDGQGHTISNFVLETTKDYQGLIGTIVAGANIHDFVLDESCLIAGNAFCGIIGGTSGSGNIYITNVGNEGTVTTVNQNAAGIIGVDNGGSMDMFITNCWVTGTITAGRESGAICGYSSGGSIVKNCWAAFTINQSGIYDCDSFTRGGAKVVNCYEADIPDVDTNKQQHYRQMGANRATITLPLEEIANGTLCYNLNGKQFLDPSWYQTLEEDAHPYPFGEHALIIYGAEQYFSVLTDDDLEDIIPQIQNYEQEKLDGIIATQSLLDELNATIEAISDSTTIASFANAITAVEAAKAAVAENAAVYQAYIDKCEEIKAFLEGNQTFSGELRSTLEYYLSADVADEPDENNPLGTYEYVIDVHTATAEEIAAETERIAKWLADAIAADYKPGSDVSVLIPNGDFSKQNESWTGGFGNSFGETQNEEGKTFVGVEAWNVTGDQYQTVEDMKPGYYLVGINAAFRPSNNRYSYNYAAGVYANGIFNYFPTVFEDYTPVDEAEDGVNCNLSIKEAYDWPVYDDYQSESGEEGLIGYVVRGETGMAIAAKAGRYQVYTIAYVGEDGKLTIGIKNPGTHYGNDWTGWGPFQLTYCGEEAGDALSEVLENMVARALTIEEYKEYWFDIDNAAVAPNFPEALLEELEDAVSNVSTANTIEEKAALVQRFSDIFQAIYEGKQAYIALFNAASAAENIGSGNLALIEKDVNPDTGEEEWSETGEMLFSIEEENNLADLAQEWLTAYQDGSYSTEEALAAANVSDPAITSVLPTKDEDGYYLISNPKQLAAYRAIAHYVDKTVKGKLVNDVDMAGIAMLPIGRGGDNAAHIYAGVFDGQGHALTNVYINDEYLDVPASLFYELQNATVKNLKLTGENHTCHQFTGGLTRWMSGNARVENCEIAVAMYFAPNLAGDASSGGVVGYNSSASSVIDNCLVNVHMVGESEGPIWYVGGVAGWSSASLQIKNTLILSQYENVGADGDNSRTTSRGTKATLSNVYVSQYFREAEGTLVTADQLASGETAWKLNGQTGDNAHWFQTLGVEATPHLFGDDVVYYYAGQYTNEKPNPQLNAFAYDLDAKLSGSNVNVTFKLNAEAEAAEVRFSNGYTKAVEGELTAGAYRVSVPTSELGSDPTALNFEIAVTGKGSLDVIRVGEPFKVWGPYGMAINNNPESKGFGQVLIAESYPTESKDPKYISCEKNGAIFAFDADFQPINAADGTPGFYGDIPNAGEEPLVIAGNFKYDLKDLRFTEDGRLFVARASGTTNSSVWEINPDDLNEPWKPVFTGGELDAATGITYVDNEEQNRMALSLAFDGTGEDLKMYVLGAQRSDGQNNTTDYNCSIYNLGLATEWTTAPSANFEPLDGVYTYSPYYVGIHGDGQGGLWYIQSVDAPSVDIPAIKHFDAEGNEDYSNTSLSPKGARIAVTKGGEYLAFPNGNGKIVLYETNYVPMENGRIFLNPKYNLSVGETSISCMAFDYANNLYVASAGSETFSRYAIPSWSEDKVVVTPGNGIGLASGDVNLDGTVDIADAVSVLNAMAGQPVAGNADVNGDGTVDIADLVTVLNIMAGQ